MQLLDKYARHLNLKRKRNEGKVSSTLNAKRPDLCVLVRSALLFTGEDKSEEGQIDQAVAELKQKMRRWSQSFHGQASLSLCMFVIGMIPSLGHVELMSLNQTCTGSSCLLCLRIKNLTSMQPRSFWCTTGGISAMLCNGGRPGQDLQAAA